MEQTQKGFRFSLFSRKRDFVIKSRWKSSWRAQLQTAVIQSKIDIVKSRRHKRIARHKLERRESERVQRRHDENPFQIEFLRNLDLIKPRLEPQYVFADRKMFLICAHMSR